MPAESSVPNAVEKIRRLKRTINPATGKVWSGKEIAEVFGKSQQWVPYMTRNLKGVCPTCLRNLEKHAKAKE